jgi:hypothetical protein
MTLRKPPPPRTPEENRARNSALLLNPPGPTLGDRIARCWDAVWQWWRRRNRELAALLDRAGKLPLDHPAYDALRESVRQQRHDGGAAGRDEQPPR